MHVVFKLLTKQQVFLAMFHTVNTLLTHAIIVSFSTLRLSIFKISAVCYSGPLIHAFHLRASPKCHRVSARLDIAYDVSEDQICQEPR